MTLPSSKAPRYTADLKPLLTLLALAIASLGARAANAADHELTIKGAHLIVSGPATGLADSAALRATVYGTAPKDKAPLPERVPLAEINVELPWARPVPDVFWFNRRLRVWFSAQKGPAPLAIVISGTGSGGNAAGISTLRAALYGAGYHVLTMPSPTFPDFIVAASSTGVAGDLLQDSRDLYQAMQLIVGKLPRRVQVTEIDVLGYSLGGANAAVVKSIDTAEGKLKIHRAVMINPPVNLFASMARLDKLFSNSIGSGDAAIENLYRRLYARLANLYRTSDSAHIDQTDFLSAAGAVLKSDADFSAAIALTFRIDLVDVVFAGDLYAGTGVVVDPKHPPRVGDSLEQTARVLRSKPFEEYFFRIFVPFYAPRRSGSSPEALLDRSGLNVIAETLRTDADYYAQTNSDDLILDKSELSWLKTTLGPRIAIYDHGGHLGNLGERQQIADMLDMLGGRWPREGR